MFDIRLFGAFQISRAGQDLRASIPEQASSILCYLLLNRQSVVHRDTIVGHYWGDSSQEKARKALRTAIWRVRSALKEENSPPILLTEPDYVFLNGEIDFWLDVEKFEALIEQANTSHDPPQPDDVASALRKAVDLYNGDLLEGWTDDWVLFERTRLQGLYVHALSELMTHCGRQKAYHEATQYGQLILNCDPLLESVHRYLMRLHYWAGNRPASVRQYRQCEALLADELGIEPMKETRLLLKQICADRVPDPVAPVAAQKRSLGYPPVNAPRMETAIRQLESIQQLLDVARQRLMSLITMAEV
jgi:DNA-binding SARP family transcriptional activator